jgi:multidrug efflux pump subunit AcrB
VRDVLAVTENPFDRAGVGPCLLVRLAPAEKKDSDRKPLLEVIRLKLAKVPDMTIRIREPSPSSGVLAYPVDLAIHGPKAAKVRELAYGLAERLRKSKKLGDVWADPAAKPQPRLSVHVDAAAARRQGVQLGDIVDTLAVLFGRLQLGEFGEPGE